METLSTVITCNVKIQFLYSGFAEKNDTAHVQYLGPGEPLASPTPASWCCCDTEVFDDLAPAKAKTPGVWGDSSSLVPSLGL